MRVDFPLKSNWIEWDLQVFQKITSEDSLTHVFYYFVVSKRSKVLCFV